MEVQITNSKYVRDLSSKAVLNTDRQGLEDYLAKREIAKKVQAEQNATKERVTIIEQDMAEIKMLLKQLLAQKDSNGN
jgi:hypothetical protein